MTSEEQSSNAWVLWEDFVSTYSDEDVASGIIAQVVDKLHESLSNLDWDGRLESWVFQIIRNRLIDRYRFAPQTSSDALPARLSTDPDSADSADVIDERFSSSLRAYAESLGGLERDAVLSLDYEGRSPAEAARDFGVTDRAMLGALDRGRGKIRRQLQRDAHEELERRDALLRRGAGCPSCDA